MFRPAFAAPPPPRVPRIFRELLFSFIRDALVVTYALSFCPSFAKGHDFVPRTIGGTTYFPIRLDEARLGYVTPSGVEVFTDQ